MYSASVWNFQFWAIMGISAHSISLSDRPIAASWVTRFRMCRCDRSSISKFVSPTSVGFYIIKSPYAAALISYLQACVIGAATVEHAPGNAGKLVGQCDDQDAAMQSL